MTSVDAVIAPLSAATGKKTFLRAQDAPPVLLVFGIVMLALAWNSWTGLRFHTPMLFFVAGPVVCFVLTGYYRLIRPERKIAETALYLGLWLLYPAFGAELIYLVTRTGFPLADKSFIALDAVLGFDWMSWARFVLAHPWLKSVQDAAYSSCFWQPLVAILILAAWGPQGRNGEFLTSVMLGLLMVIALYMVLPTIGPADMQGIRATGQIVESLRSGNLGPYNYVGIIAFPSFHTVMAILFTTVHRGNRWCLAGFGLLNLVMLSAVPFQGDHYLSDMIAGAAIAGIAFLAAKRIYRFV